MIKANRAVQTLPVPSPPLLICAWPYVEWGGVQIYFLNLLRSAVSEFEVRVVLPEKSSPTLLGFLRGQTVEYDELPARSESVPVHGLAARVRRRYRKIRSESVFRRHLLATARGSAIVHIDVAPWSSSRLLAALARRNLTFVTLHTRLPEPGPLRRRLWRRRLRKLAHEPRFHLIAANLDARESLMPYLGSWVESNVPVAYTGVDLDEIEAAEGAPKDRAQLTHDLGLPNDRTLVVAAGQFIERKGVSTLLEAVALLAQHDPSVFFVWLGTEDLSRETAARINRLVGSECFRYIPSRLSGTSHISFLTTLSAITDIFVLPSLVEGLPLVLVEAMALGKPIVATRINGIPEAIVHERNGLLVEPGRADSLAEAIAFLADHPEIAQRFGAAARRTAVADFDQRSTTEVTLQAYRSAIRMAASTRPEAGGRERAWPA